MSPKSRGRPPGRGRKRTGNRGPSQRSGPGGIVRAPGGLYAAEPIAEEGEVADYLLGDPDPGDRRSWAVPPAHGVYRGMELERLDPDDEDQLTFLLEAHHPEMAEALELHEEMVTASGDVINPTMHVLLHTVVAKQILADDPPQTWQAVQRLAGLGYDWHNVMHMISELVSNDLWHAQAEGQAFDLADYLRRLAELPGDWPSPEELGL
jgi:hypothetical protein